jgi:hypothetical protein
VPSSRLHSLLTALTAEPCPPTTTDRLIEHFTADYEPFSLSPLLPTIETCFQDYNVRAILERLKGVAEGHGHTAKWAVDTLELIKRNSPLATVVTARALELGAKSTFKQALERELGLSKKFMETADLREGVRAKLIDKTNAPKWTHDSIDGVEPGLVDSFFASAPLQTYNNRDFADYPVHFGLPTVGSVKRVVLENRRATKAEIVEHFATRQHDKMGVREHVGGIVGEFVIAVNGELKWDSRGHFY